MNQISSIGIGTDITVMAGYAQAAGDKLGAFDLIFENVGQNTATIRLMAFDGTTSPSGYAGIATATQQANQALGGFTVVAGGTATRSYVVLNKRVAFFGSGSTLMNITPVIRNKGDLRGAQIDILAGGRKNWQFDPAFDKGTLTKKWGKITPAANPAGSTGEVDPTVNNPSYDGGNTKT